LRLPRRRGGLPGDREREWRRCSRHCSAGCAPASGWCRAGRYSARCHYIVSELLPRYGIETALVDGRDLGAWEAALADGAALAFCESPSNPAMEIIDLAEVARLTHRASGLLVVDNVFATPLLQKPLALAPMSSSIPRPSTSMARGAVSAAPSCIGKIRQG